MILPFLLFRIATMLANGWSICLSDLEATVLSLVCRGSGLQYLVVGVDEFEASIYVGTVLLAG